MTHSAALLFMHIPKTAGTSVSLALAQQFRSDDLYHVRSETTDLAPKFSPNYGPEETFRTLDPRQRSRYRCVLGHYHFGLHAALSGAGRYFTLLRDPLERYVSQVAQYNRMAASGELGSGVRPVTLAEFREVKPAQFTNPQTRWIAGSQERAPKAALSPQLLDRALENIERHFVVVGLVERMDESLTLLARQWGWRSLSVGRANVSAVRPSYDEFTPALRDEFEDHNQFDRTLWRLASERLDEARRAAAPVERAVTVQDRWRRWTQKFSRRSAA